MQRKWASSSTPVFRRVRLDEGIISLRSFLEQKDAADKGVLLAAKLTSGLDEVINRAIGAATHAANADPPRVFCPPVAVFRRGGGASKADLLTSPVLAVDCDQNPTMARIILERLLGPASAVVYSGGEWLDPLTGELQPKCHLYWVLNKPAEGNDELARLEQAAKLA